MECISPIGGDLAIDDCLACSGCISVNKSSISKHSAGVVYFQSTKAHGEKVLALSPQAKISLFFQCGTEKSPEEFRFFERVFTRYLKECGFIEVVDTSHFNSAVAAAEHARLDLSGTMVSSVCPGIAALVEGSAPHLLPHLSISSTPQELAVLYLRKKHPSPVTVVTLMPCFDKKLEAEREENRGLIDYVTTPVEVHKEVGESLREYYRDKRSRISSGIADEVVGGVGSMENSLPLKGSSSGGVTEYLLERVLESHPGTRVSSRERTDHVEREIVIDGRTYIFAQIYGIPKTTNFCVRSKDRNYLSKYTYVELMACKGSCIQGVAQITPGGEESALYEALAAGAVSGRDMQEEHMRPRTFKDLSKKKKSYAVAW
jgi:iron only hydrogenase large subunit-like protein